ncbi:hypothetical protein [Micromonospora sp. NPDC003816]|uniref:hypothetical protein n=1 Tax=Micromonospora sp. NPDC003816 TaxID=3364224 RepID=UPI003686EBA5
MDIEPVDCAPEQAFRRPLDLDDDLVTAAGLPRPIGPPASVLYSPGVAVRFGASVTLRRPAGR